MRDKSKWFSTITTALGSLSGVAIVLRVVSKLILGMEIGPDDYTIILSFTTGVPATVILVQGIQPALNSASFIEQLLTLKLR